MPAKRRAKSSSRCCKQCRKRVPLSKMKKLRRGRAGICQKCDAANARTNYWKNASATRRYATNRAQEIMAARVEQDRADATAAKESLAEQWGDSAGDNLKSVNGLLKSLPASLSKAIREARSNNGLGSRLANEPAFLAMLSEYAALKAGGPSAGIFDGQADQKRITEIRRARSDDFPTYIRHGLDAELATLEARQAARAPAAEGERPGDRARETEIRKVLARNYSEYRDQKLDVELSQILQRRGA